jgi:hypothetical protein
MMPQAIVDVKEGHLKSLGKGACPPKRPPYPVPQPAVPYTASLPNARLPRRPQESYPGCPSLSGHSLLFYPFSQLFSHPIALRHTPQFPLFHGDTHISATLCSSFSPHTSKTRLTVIVGFFRIYHINTRFEDFGDADPY